MPNETKFTPFRIYPGSKRGCFVVVSCFDTSKAMHRYCKKNCQFYMGRDAAGVCHSYTKARVYANGRRRIQPQIGEIHLCSSHSDAGTVAHECYHAALHYWRRKTRKSDVVIHDDNDKGRDGTEEQFGDVLGRLVGQTIDGLYACGFYGGEQ